VWLNIPGQDGAGRDDTSVPQDNARQHKNASPEPAPIADPNRCRRQLSASPFWPANVMCGSDDRNVVTDGHVVANSHVATEVDMQRRCEKAGASDR
jgi:hypothetical protein